MTILETTTVTSDSDLICSTWAGADDLCAPCTDYAVDPDLLVPYLDQASEILFIHSHRKYPGICEETVIPCSRNAYSVRHSTYSSTPTPASVFGANRLIACACHDLASCSCSSLPAISLRPGYPIVSIDSVVVDGITLDETDYELRADGTLVRLDGDSWPCCADTAEDFSVTYTYGADPPSLGVTAAATLACELYLACNPGAVEGASCRLPRNLQSISRQGVSAVIIATTPRPGGPNFKFGIWEIDTFIETYAPYGARDTSVLLSPDTMPTHRRLLSS